MIRFLLFILRSFRLLFYKSGVDFDKMITIIRTKLTIDNRTSKNINSNKTKQINSALLQQGFSMLVMGTFALLMTWSKSGLTTAILLYHSMILVMLILSLLSEYTQMLFDSRDTHILLRLPVDSRTISTAKLITIGYYMLFLSFCSALIPTLVFIFTKGVATGLLLLSATLLNTLFALLLTNLVYMGCMRFASGEKYTQLYPDPYDCTCRLQLSIGSQYPRQPHTGTDSIRSLVVLSPASGMVHGADRTVSGSFCHCIPICSHRNRPAFYFGLCYDQMVRSLFRRSP